jgi:hypothetical protein
MFGYRALRSYFVNLETDDEPAINETRALACEFVAWRLLLQLSEKDAIDYLLQEFNLSGSSRPSSSHDEESSPLLSPNVTSPIVPVRQRAPNTPNSRPLGVSRLLSSPGLRIEVLPDLTMSTDSFQESSQLKGQEFAVYFDRLNALEVGVVSNSKKFLSQRIVQKLMGKIWRGDIVFWETLSVNSVKKAMPYNKKYQHKYMKA